MLIDSQTVYSWQQSAFASGADVVSTNIYDFAPHLAANAAWAPDLGIGEEWWVAAIITTTFTGGTSVQPVLQTDTNTNFATALVEFPFCTAIPVASALVGVMKIMRMPAGLKRYTRIAWRNVGANAAGAASAFMVKDIQLTLGTNNIPMAAGYTVG
jgi:hypothetical protein